MPGSVFGNREGGFFRVKTLNFTMKNTKFIDESRRSADDATATTYVVIRLLFWFFGCRQFV